MYVGSLFILVFHWCLFWFPLYVLFCFSENSIFSLRISAEFLLWIALRREKISVLPLKSVVLLLILFCSTFYSFVFIIFISPPILVSMTRIFSRFVFCFFHFFQEVLTIFFAFSRFQVLKLCAERNIFAVLIVSLLSLGTCRDIS